MLRVRDDGIGIERNLLPQVFDLFTQADRSVARSQGGPGHRPDPGPSLVELHGGASRPAARAPAQGASSSSACRSLVATPVAEELQSASGNEIPAPTMPHRRVLVVDDNVDAARSFAEIAGLWQHEVRVAHNGTAALEMAGTYHPDIVLLDIGLPGMSGYQVAEQLRRQPEFAQTTLVAVTGYGQEEDRRRSREAGFNHHLVKPVAPDTIYQLLAAPATAG